MNAKCRQNAARYLVHWVAAIQHGAQMQRNKTAFIVVQRHVVYLGNTACNYKTVFTGFAAIYQLHLRQIAYLLPHCKQLSPTRHIENQTP